MDVDNSGCEYSEPGRPELEVWKDGGTSVGVDLASSGLD